MEADSLEGRIWNYFLENSKKNGTKLLLKKVFESPLSIPSNRRGKFLNKLLEDHQLSDIVEAQSKLKFFFLAASEAVDFEGIVDKRSFRRKHEVLLTIKDILENLRGGNVRSKITKKKAAKEDKKVEEIKEEEE